MNDYLDTIEFNVKTIAKRKKNIISQLDDFEEETVALPSSILDSCGKKASEKELKKALKEERSFRGVDDVIDTSEDADWAFALASFDTPVSKVSTKDIFKGKKKGKKKKKKKEGELVNHKKEFEVEIALLKSLQNDQAKFVDSLQKKYDQMEASKSSARGVGKFTTDLIMSITSARTLSRQLVSDIISTKKTIADLDFKERKEFGKNIGADALDSAQYASNFLKEMLTKGRANLSGEGGELSIEDIDDTNDMFDAISDSLGETDRDDDVETYLKYENDNVSIKVYYREEYEDSDNLDDLYDFVAITEDGRRLYDYPLPKKTRLSVNKSTAKCKDTYGNQYDMVFV